MLTYFYIFHGKFGIFEWKSIVCVFNNSSFKKLSLQENVQTEMAMAKRDIMTCFNSLLPIQTIHSE